MDHGFWMDMWARDNIPFHRSAFNPLMVEHFAALSVAPPGRVFVPLCGKTRDIGWLLAQGYQVAGVELSPLAIEQLFAELGVAPDITAGGPLPCWQAPGLQVFVGDMFDLDAAALGPVDAVYDRAAVIALPPDLRTRYAALMVAITRRAPQLMIGLEHDTREGPPFSVDQAELHRLYGADYALTLLGRTLLPGAPPGRSTQARDTAWILR